MIWVAVLAFAAVVSMFWRPTFRLPKPPKWKVPSAIDILDVWSRRRVAALKQLLALQLVVGALFIIWGVYQ